ncbi:MAG: flagellin [Oscillospiraceae bacterium]|nr:flagellin [Oscillospiraceae bacterium]
MRIQHNIMAMNAFRNYNTNTGALSKNLEKLSSGYKINRAGDDAAGLAISEKMRAQISGLKQAQSNVKDGISLVKTAEGALQEVQDMMNRMVTLATQSANGTYDNDVDRDNLQKEVEALATEIDRIADASNFNGKALLNGDLAAVADVTYNNGGGAAASFEAVAVTGVSDVTTTGLTNAGDVKVKVDDITGAKATANGASALADLTFTAGANGESFNGWKIEVKAVDTATAAAATKDEGTKTITINLGTNGGSGASGAYNAADLQTAVQALGGDWASATVAGTGTIAKPSSAADVGSVTLADGADAGKKVTITDQSGTIGTQNFTTAEWVDTVTVDTTNVDLKIDTTNAAGLAAAATKIGTVTAGTETAATTVLDYTDKTGADVIGTTVKVDGVVYEFAKTGETAKTANAVTVNVAEDAADSAIATALQAKLATHANYADATTDAAKWDADVGTGDDNDAKITLTTGAKGAAAKALEVEQDGGGLVLQIGDTADSYNQMKVQVGDMHTKALKIDKDSINVKTQAAAADAIKAIKTAINTVSGTRGDLGAIQNRLEHTTNNLAIMTENIQDAESTIRDVDIADEMTAYTKNNILLQSAQAMLAQANQMPQGVLQLLQ